LHCQKEVGDILKNLFQKGITENKIVAVKALIDILLHNSSSIGVGGGEGNNIAKTNIKHKIFKNLSSNSNSNNNNNSNYNWKKGCEKSTFSISFCFDIISFEILSSSFIFKRYFSSISLFSNGFIEQLMIMALHMN
jgi:hypothetical protein